MMLNQLLGSDVPGKLRIASSRIRTFHGVFRWPSCFKYFRPDRAFHHNAPGFCPVCDVWIESALEMTQLWRCPVEWCAVWKGSVRVCQEHLSEKHGGSSLFALKNVAKSPPPPPPLTVSRHVWQTALRPDVSGVAVDARLFHEAGCRLVHRYRVHRDPFPHPALREGVIPRLLSCVCRAMAIARLTYLQISIPASGAPPGHVPADCFPGGRSSEKQAGFASGVVC